MVVLKPLRTAPKAPTVCTSLQTLSHRLQKIHLSMLRTMEEVTSRLRNESSPPVNGISRTLKRRARFCNSQLPDFGQVRQSFGWSDRISSATIFRAFITRSVLVRTVIPSVHLVAQAGARFFLPSTSTTQIRQEAGLFLIQVPFRSMWQRVGMFMPISVAASKIVVPTGTAVSYTHLTLPTT